MLRHQYLLDLASRYGAQAAIFFLNFLLAKAAVFAGPILLARVLDTALYGQIEFAWSAATIMAALLGLGISAALPQLTLLHRPIWMIDILAASVVVPGTLLLLGAATLLSIVGADLAALVMLIIVLAMLQANLSSYSRTFSYRNWASWLDGLMTHVVVVVMLLIATLNISNIRNLITGVAAASVLGILAGTWIMLRNLRSDFFGRLSVVFATGLPLLAYSLCSIWAAISARVYFGLTLTAEGVAMYSVCFRLASLILIIHSIVATGLFAHIYRMRTREYDYFLSMYQLAMSIVSVAMILLFDVILSLLNLRAIGGVRAETVALFPIVMLQVYAWNAWATLEMRVARARRAGRAALFTTVLMGIIAILIFLLAWMRQLSLPLASVLVALQMIFGVAVQFYVLWRRGMKMPRAMLAMGAGGLAIVLVGWMRI